MQMTVTAANAVMKLVSSNPALLTEVLNPDELSSLRRIAKLRKTAIEQTPAGRKATAQRLQKEQQQAANIRLITKKIQPAVAAHFGLEKRYVTGAVGKRPKPIVMRARYLAIYLSYTFAPCIWKDIGAEFGVMASSAHTMFQKAEELLTEDKSFHEECQKLVEKLGLSDTHQQAA